MREPEPLGFRRQSDRAHHRKSDAPIPELTRVTLASNVTDQDNRIIPAGSTGTVVGTYRDGLAYEVEFTEPFHSVATVESSAIRR